MACKFKKFDNSRFCQVIHGECQFIKSPYDDMCPILAAYINYDKYWLDVNTDENNQVKVDNIKIDDGDLEAEELDIQF